MKRRIPALLLVLALVVCAAIGLAACNEGGKDGSKTGDKIFTEDASLAEIISALENAESFTIEGKLSFALVGFEYYEDGQMNQVVRIGRNAMYSTLTTKYDGGIIREEELYFIEGNESYYVSRSYENGTENETVVKEKKSPEQYRSFFLGMDFYIIRFINGGKREDRSGPRAHDILHGFVSAAGRGQARHRILQNIQ